MMIFTPKKLTRSDYIKSLEARGRHKGKPIGSYVIDLADLKKTIVLCNSCSAGFDAKRHRYVQPRQFPVVQGKCDACRNHFMAAKMFVHETNINASIR